MQNSIKKTINIQRKLRKSESNKNKFQNLKNDEH